MSGQGRARLPGYQISQLPKEQQSYAPPPHGLTHLYRLHESQWRRLATTIDSIHRLTQRIRESLNEIRHSQVFSDQGTANFERMALDRMIREASLLEQQQQSVLKQIAQALPNTTQPHRTDIEDEENVIATCPGGS